MEFKLVFTKLSSNVTNFMEKMTITTVKEKQLCNLILRLLSSLRQLLSSFSQYQLKVGEKADKFLTRIPELLKLINTARNSKPDFCKNDSSDKSNLDVSSELFETVYDPQVEINKKLEDQINSQSQDISKLKELLYLTIEKCNASISENNHKVLFLKSKLEECKLSLQYSIPRKKEFKGSYINNNMLDVQFICIDSVSYREKYKNILERILNDNKERRKALITTDEPISNNELKAFKESLIGMNTKNCINELRIENAYISEGLWIGEILMNNAKSIKKVSIAKTLLDVTGIIKILSAIKSSKIRLEELNMDENKLQGSDLNLLAKLFNGINIKKFSIKKNPLDIYSIEDFVRATLKYTFLEEIDIGDIEISEQKELEWRTNFTSLSFNKVYNFE